MYWAAAAVDLIFLMIAMAMAIIGYEYSYLRIVMRVIGCTHDGWRTP